MDETKKITIEINEEDLSEMNCMKCRVLDFKESLCEDEFCKMYYGEGNGIDFINAVKASACPTVPVDDLISRQAAIDAINGFKQGAAEWRDKQEERSDIWHRADSAIASALEIGLRVKKLPSAQQWIPCSEKLPEENEMVLISAKYIGHLSQNAPYVEEGFLTRAGWYSTYGDNYSELLAKVIAWMPLPEPYKGEEA